MIACGEIISAVDIVSMKITNTIATNMSINPDDKNVSIKLIAIFWIQFY